MNKILVIFATLSLIIVGCHGGGEISFDPGVKIEKITEISECPQATAATVVECANVPAATARVNPALQLIPKSVGFLMEASVTDFILSNLYKQFKNGVSEVPEAIKDLPILPELIEDAQDLGSVCSKGWPIENSTIAATSINNSKIGLEGSAIQTLMTSPELISATSMIAVGVKPDDEEFINGVMANKGFVMVGYGNYASSHLDKLKNLVHDVPTEWVDETDGDIIVFSVLSGGQTKKVALLEGHYILGGDATTVDESLAIYKKAEGAENVTTNKTLWGMFSSIPAYTLRFAYYYAPSSKIPDKVKWYDYVKEYGLDYFFDSIENEAPKMASIAGGINMATKSVIHLQAHAYSATEPDFSTSIAMSDKIKVKWANALMYLLAVSDYNDVLKE